MSPTLFSGAARAGIHARVDRLSPDSAPLWGTMRATQLVCHVADQLRVALGDIEARRRRLALRFGDREVEIDPGLLRFKLGRRLLVHAVPWPRARIGASPEFLTTAPSEWREDVATLHALVDRVGARSPDGSWGTHPVFGQVCGPEWGLLCWRHLDHHLRQFRV